MIVSCLQTQPVSHLDATIVIIKAQIHNTSLPSAMSFLFLLQVNKSTISVSFLISVAPCVCSLSLFQEQRQTSTTEEDEGAVQKENAREAGEE